MFVIVAPGSLKHPSLDLSLGLNLRFVNSSRMLGLHAGCGAYLKKKFIIIHLKFLLTALLLAAASMVPPINSHYGIVVIDFSCTFGTIVTNYGP